MHKKGLELIFNCHNVVCGCLTTIALDDKKSCWMKEMTFCFHNYSDLLWKQFTFFLWDSIFLVPDSSYPKYTRKNLLEPCLFVGHPKQTFGTSYSTRALLFENEEMLSCNHKRIFILFIYPVQTAMIRCNK